MQHSHATFCMCVIKSLQMRRKCHIAWSSPQVKCLNCGNELHIRTSLLAWCGEPTQMLKSRKGSEGRLLKCSAYDEEWHCHDIKADSSFPELLLDKEEQRNQMKQGSSVKPDLKAQWVRCFSPRPISMPRLIRLFFANLISLYSVFRSTMFRMSSII